MASEKKDPEEKNKPDKNKRDFKRSGDKKTPDSAHASPRKKKPAEKPGSPAESENKDHDYPYPQDEYSDPENLENLEREDGPEPEERKAAKKSAEKSGARKTDRPAEKKSPAPHEEAYRKSDAAKDEPVAPHEVDRKKKIDEKKMPFLDHLEELRWTILWSLVAVVVAAIVCYIFSSDIITLLRAAGPDDLKLIFLAPTEGFMIHIKVAMFAGLVVALPVVSYQFWKFIVPGLLDKERKLVPPIVFFTVLCFVSGALFAYFIIIPFGMNFLLGFQTPGELEANITIGKYLGFVVTIILVFGVVFELPVLSFFLTKIGILTPTFLSKNRRYGIVVIFILAAVLTPPDIFTQLMLAGPLLLLYEISIVVSRIVIKKAESNESGEAF